MRLLFIHGLGDDPTAWSALLPHMEDQEVDVVTVPGFGGRPWNGESLEDVAQQLIPSEPAIVVGHSMGGAIATLMAEADSPTLRGIVNIEGNLTRAGCFLSSRAVGAPDFGQWFTAFNRKWQGTRYGAALEGCSPSAFHSYATDLIRISEADVIGHRYKALTAPHIYVYGERSISDDSRNLLGGEASAGVAGAGHWVVEDDPERVDAIVRAFAANL